MESMKVATTSRNSGKQSFLPPKSPFPSISAPTYVEYGSTGSRGAPKQREGNRHHQRTSSESFIIEEQPSWLDDLLNEPETPLVRRGAHRRSSSDSFAYLDGSYAYSMDNLALGECMGRSTASIPSWGLNEFSQLNDVQNQYSEGSLFSKNLFNRQQNRVWESAFKVGNYPNSVPAKEKNLHPRTFGAASKEPDSATSCAIERQEQEDPPNDSVNGLEMKNDHQVKQSQPESDAKRVKQQFAQRSRVRKLQYIAELEKNVQVLQAEQMEVSVELEILDQQNLILNLENKALKQRLDGLAQEHLVKCQLQNDWSSCCGMAVQQEMLERDIARLRSLFQQQQQQQLPQEVTRPPSRSGGVRELETQFPNLSLSLAAERNNSGRDPVTGLRI